MLNDLVILIDAVSSGFSVESAATLAHMSVKEASQAIAEHGEAIRLRKEEIERDEAIILPSHRWYLLNQAADMGINGYAVANKDGISRMTFNPALAISAVKVANEMSNAAPQIQNDQANMTKVIIEMFKELTQDEMHSDEDAWALIEEAMPTYEGVVKQLRLNYAGKQTDRT